MPVAGQVRVRSLVKSFLATKKDFWDVKHHLWVVEQYQLDIVGPELPSVSGAK